MNVEEILNLKIDDLHKMSRAEKEQLLAPLLPASRRVDEEARAEKDRKSLQGELNRLLIQAGLKK